MDITCLWLAPMPSTAAGLSAKLATDSATGKMMDIQDASKWHHAGPLVGETDARGAQNVNECRCAALSS